MIDAQFLIDLGLLLAVWAGGVVIVSLPTRKGKGNK